MERPPLLSVITPTWGRPDLLEETIREVRAQDYPRIEHIVVSDGPDTKAATVMERMRHRWSVVAEATFYNEPDAMIRGTALRYIELGRQWTEFFHPNGFGIGAIVAGLLQARGDYFTIWCDDERADPDHLSKMVALLEEHGVDFAYPKVRFWRNGTSPEQGFDIGTNPPTHGQFTHYVARMTALKKAMPRWDGHPVDWTLCDAWMAAGATWAYLPEVTFSHRADH